MTSEKEILRGIRFLPETFYHKNRENIWVYTNLYFFIDIPVTISLHDDDILGSKMVD